MSTLSPNMPAEGILIAWYGDDFTGAAAVMEVLTFAGLPSMLFLDVPSPAQLDRFRGLRCIGVASTARAQSPGWMDAELPGVFDRLAALDPQLVHYKICSTLDSSPRTGSIGRAIEIGADRMSTATIPLLVAAPQMKRFQFYGHLFAGIGDEVFRLDRHPVMSRHPVTPMTESDVGQHVARQSTRIDPGTLTLDALANGAGISVSDSGDSDRIKLITVDCIDDASETAAGRAIWQARQTSPFVVGSQGVEYALVEHWRASGDLPTIAPPGGIGRAKRMVSVSGSVSPTTASQIAWSKANGFAGIAFDATVVCGDQAGMDREIGRVVDAAMTAMANGEDPLVHTAEGPADPAVQRFRAAVDASQITTSDANRSVGEALGRVLHQVLQQSGAGRAVVSGGDTSGFATQKLGIFALSALAPTIPGASIFRAHADGPMDGLELALKGGQMGSPDYFGWVRDGGGAR